MIIGQTVVAENSTGTVVYTPWFPRQGNDCTSVLDIIAISGDARVDVDMETKNSDQIDSAAGSMGSVSDKTASTSFSCTNAKELCRYKITVKYYTTGTSIVYAHFRMLAPSWETTGAQGV